MSALEPSPGTVVLVVEDEVLVREDTIDVLEGQGFEALRAANFEAALKALDARPDVDAVFTDIQMPDPRDGLDLARHVAAHHPGAAILITSGCSFAAPPGMPPGSRFIPKPYRPGTVVSLLREMIGESPAGGWNSGFGRPSGDCGSSPSPR